MASLAGLTKPVARLVSVVRNRSFTFIAILAVTMLLSDAAMADPILGTITLTIAPIPGLELGAAASSAPVVYSSGLVDLSQPFQGEILPGGAVTSQGLTLTGPHLDAGFGGLPETFDTTFQMQITFDGNSGHGSKTPVFG